MKLHIRNITKEDFMEYRCVARNSLGDSDGSITLYGKFWGQFSKCFGSLEYACYELFLMQRYLVRPPQQQPWWQQLVRRPLVWGDRGWEVGQIWRYCIGLDRSGGLVLLNFQLFFSLLWCTQIHLNRIVKRWTPSKETAATCYAINLKLFYKNFKKSYEKYIINQPTIAIHLQ